MNTLVNLVHPYTYKMRGESLILGPREECRERDLKLGAFVSKALDAGASVIASFPYPSGVFKRHMEELAYSLDPLFGFLADERIKKVCIPRTGIPLPDDKPEKTPHESWALLTKHYVRESVFRALASGFERVVFIGGTFENCLGNAANHYATTLRKNGESMIYVPELCVSFDQAEYARVAELLKQREILPERYESAFALLS